MLSKLVLGMKLVLRNFFEKSGSHLSSNFTLQSENNISSPFFEVLRLTRRKIAAIKHHSYVEEYSLVWKLHFRRRWESWKTFDHAKAWDTPQVAFPYLCRWRESEIKELYLIQFSSSLLAFFWGDQISSCCSGALFFELLDLISLIVLILGLVVLGWVRLTQQWPKTKWKHSLF